jgi:hypothetical protein
MSQLPRLLSLFGLMAIDASATPLLSSEFFGLDHPMSWSPVPGQTCKVGDGGCLVTTDGSYSDYDILKLALIDTSNGSTSGIQGDDTLTATYDSWKSQAWPILLNGLPLGSRPPDANPYLAVSGTRQPFPGAEFVMANSGVDAVTQALYTLHEPSVAAQDSISSGSDPFEVSSLLCANGSSLGDLSATPEPRTLYILVPGILLAAYFARRLYGCAG